MIFGRFLTLSLPEKISVGDHVILSNFVCINSSGDSSIFGQIVLERNVFIGTFCSLKTGKDGEIVVREGANIGSCCSLQTDSLLEIGEDTLLAGYCSLGLPATTPNGTTDEQSSYTSVGSECWLGVRVQQNAGTTIGKGSIIGAHASVATDIPDMSIAVGHPAQVQRSRSEREQA